MATSPITTRLPPWLEDEVGAFWRQRGESRSRGLRHVAEEWWVHNHLPAIEFRDGVSGRRAALREGPDVWEIAGLARDYGADLDAMGAHMGGHISREALSQALAYIDRFPEQIAEQLAENERVEQLLRERSGGR